MKLPNGFGSHRYVYSPILFDSQDIYPKDVKKVSELNPHALPTAGGAASPVTIIPDTGWPLVMQMENGDDVQPSCFLEHAAPAAPGAMVNMLES